MNIQKLVLAVEEYVEQRLHLYIEELTGLCAIDTYSYHKPGLDTLAALLAARLHRIGMEAEVIEHAAWGNDLYGCIRGRGEGTVVLIGHIDTVYPVGTAAQRPVRVEGGSIYGPGVCDMKGGVLLGIFAIEALLSQHFQDFGEIRLLCVSDEEIATRHSLGIMEKALLGSQRALVLEAARSNGDLVSARKGNASYVLTARGRSAHSGVEPEKGRNAIVELAHQLLRVQNMNGWRDGLTINPGVISGGTLPNVVPDYAQARFDLRFLHSEDKRDIEEQWRTMLKQSMIDGVELTLEQEAVYKEPMAVTPESDLLARQAQEIAALLDFKVNHVLTGGASDASFASLYDIPTLDGLGPVGGLDHSPYEYILRDSIAPRAALLAGLIASRGIKNFEDI